MGLSDESKSRILVRQGKMLLKYPPLMELGCLVTDLDEIGCIGHIFFQKEPAETAAAWRSAFASKNDLHVSLEIPPYLNDFETLAQVRNVTHLSTHTEIELRFEELGMLDQILLQEAVSALATRKGKKGNSKAVPKPTEPAAILPPSRLAPLKFKKVGEVLVHMGHLTAAQAQDALLAAQARGERFGHYLVRKKLVTSAGLCRALALQSDLPMTDLTDCQVAENAAAKFTQATLRRFEFVPFDETKSVVCIALANPLKPNVIKEIEALCGKRIEIFIAQEEQVLKLLDTLALKPPATKERKHIRYKASLAVKYQFCNRLGAAAEPALHEGFTVNLSEGGMLIDGPASALGSPDDLKRRGMCLRINLPCDSGPDIQAVCQMRMIREQEKTSESEARWLIGIELFEMSAVDRRRLKEVCIKAATNLQKKHSRQKFSD